MIRLEHTTKPNGSGRCWVEIGQFSAPDDFGDRKWKPSEARYPQNDACLKVQRKYDGRGASQRIYWIIDIPENYPLTIIERGAKNMILFQPKES